MTTMGTHFFTSITANYLPKARVLARSIRTYYPSATIHVVLSDKTPAWLKLECEPFNHLITLEDLPIPNLRSWLFQHDLVELSTAVKGFALQQILSRPDCEQVIYFDPDIVVLSSLDGLLQQFHNASILLTPHQLEPETQPSSILDNELLALRHGIFNLGFLGVKNSPEGRRFAAWWTDRLRDFCFDDVPGGLFTDQRWADFIPAFFPDHKVLRDPGYNVATWNLSHRRVEGTLEEGLTVNGRRLVFYHFSGLDSGSQLGMLQRYGSDMPALFALRDWYLEECDRNGDLELNSLPWAYGFFANGEPILKAQRRRYRQDPGLQARFPDPFESFEAPASVPALQPEEPLAPYRIFLIAAPADEVHLDEMLPGLLRNTVNKEQLWLVANTLERDIQSISVEATCYEDFAAHILQTFADKDIVLIRAGALTPPQWDLRLAWTAARHPGALTISPVDRRVLDRAGVFSSFDSDALDRLCYFYREDNELESAFFSQDCVYIKSSGLRSLAIARDQLRLTSLLEDAPRQRPQHLLATHICLSFLCPLTNAAVSKAPNAGDWSLRALNDRLRNHSPSHGFYLPPSVTSTFSGATLHISHSWSGGVEQWIRTFSEADADHEHFVLKSVGPDGMFGGKVYLYRYGQAGPELLDAWSPAPAIRAAAIAHRAYQDLLSELKNRFPIARIIVSSLIGHSLDCLRTGLPTTLVCHEYSPFCSALEENPLSLRSEFVTALKENNVTLVASSPAVITNYLRLAPELQTQFRLIRHAPRHLLCDDTHQSMPSGGPLRVLVLGRLAPDKSQFLLESLLEPLLPFAELTLAGCLDDAKPFASYPNIRIIPDYQQEDLPELISELRPDAGLLLSTELETFSDTLHQLQCLCVPPVAIDAGAFADAIEDEVTGFLCEPDPFSFLARLRYLNENRSALAAVRGNLSRKPRRTLDAMVQEYAALAPYKYSPELYFSGPHVPEPLPNRALQIYWREPNGHFSEQQSFVFAPFHPERQTARLYIPATASGIAQLRLDLGLKPGIISIHGVTLLRSDGQRVWSACDARSLLAGAAYDQLYSLNPTVLCLTGNDPQLTLQLPTAVLAQLSEGGYMDLDFAWHTVESHTADLLGMGQSGFLARKELAVFKLEASEQMTRLISEFNLLFETQRDRADSELEMARRHSETLEAMNRLMQASLSWQITKPVRLLGKLRRKVTGGS